MEKYCDAVEKIKERIYKISKNVKIVAVSKTFSSDKIKKVYLCGLKDFGENYVQEMLKKQEDLKELDIKWHFIGHLQRNKVKYIVGKVELLHSLDSLRLAEELNRRLEKEDLTMRALIQINIGKEATKSGIMPEEVDDFIEKMKRFKRLEIKGFMTIPPVSENREETRKFFVKMRKIFERYRGVKEDNIDIKELSMGMSADFDIAVEEGATIVRIGTLIFGKRS